MPVVEQNSSQLSGTVIAIDSISHLSQLCDLLIVCCWHATILVVTPQCVLHVLPPSFFTRLLYICVPFCLPSVAKVCLLLLRCHCG